MKRKIIIGDIHGCYYELESLLEKVGVNKDDEIITVGDFVDRGPDSLKVAEFFINNPRAKAICGNHERKHIRKISSYSQEITKLQLGIEYNKIVKWMGELPYFYEKKDVIVVHAALIPGVQLAKQHQEILAGTTSGEKRLDKILNSESWYKLYKGNKPVVFGHHYVGDSPLVHNDLVYGIDTGAFHGGFLTAITIPDFKIYSVKSRENYWEIEKKKWQEKVLINKEWGKMDWSKLDTEIKYLKNFNDYGISKYVKSLECWIENLKDSITDIIECVEKITNKILSENGENGFAEVAKNYNISRLLFMCFHGRLNREVLLKNYMTPEKTIELAKILGMKVNERINNK